MELPSPYDAGVHPDLGDGVDVGVQGAPDAGARYEYGRRVADRPANILFVSRDESEVLYRDGRGRLMRVDPDDGAPEVVIEGAPLVYGPLPSVWLFSHVTGEGSEGRVQVYLPTTSSVTAVTRASAYGLLWRAPDGETAIATDNYQIGQGRTSSRAADLVYVSSDGLTSEVIAHSPNLGTWDDERNRFSGGCTPLASFTSSTTAFIAACVGPDNGRTLMRHHQPTATTTTIAQSVRSFLVPGDNREFMLWADKDADIWGVSADGSQVVRLQESQRVTTLRVLDRNWFIYATNESQLKIASWPDMRPELIVTFGARSIRGIAPSGSHVVFSPRSSGRGELFLVPTTRGLIDNPVALSNGSLSYQGDDVFSADGAWAHWYDDADDDLIGTLMSRRTDLGERATRIADRVYYVRNTADADSVMMMINAATDGESQQLIADLAVAPRDGSGPTQILAPGVDARDFAVFPSGGRIVYEIPSGPMAGIWVRDLP